MYEKLNVRIELSAKTTSINPQIEVLLNQQIIISKQEVNTNKVLEFDLSLEENKEYNLILDRTNHDGRNPQSLTFEKFYIDEIDLDKLLDETYFYPLYPQPWHTQQLQAGHDWPEAQKGWRQWGFNGRWILKFSTPFYTWLLDNT
jgi:hypothetical protein|tara:strand:- start:2059 stop:2493 length:435 start_codon:yes stop_codon:yes gene_type:complete